MNESFAKFLAQFDGLNKPEDDLTAYEKFGTKPKSARRKIMREAHHIATHAPARLDLHGRTIAESETAVLDFVRRHNGETIEIITGRSGKMCALFPEWAAGFLSPFIAEYKLLPTGGAWSVRIKKCPSL